MKHAKRISDSIGELDDVNEKVAITKAVTSLLIEEIGLNYNGRLLMVSELLQTEIGLDIIREQNGENKLDLAKDDLAKDTKGLSYVS